MFFAILAEIVTWGGLIGTIIAVVLAVRGRLILTPVSLQKARAEWLHSFSSASSAEGVSASKSIVGGVNRSSKTKKEYPHQNLQRALDVILALVALGCLLPIFALFALLIRLDSPGPVLYLQRRVGKDGREFFMFKLRTVYVDAEQRLEAMLKKNSHINSPLKVRQDLRITRMGSILRRSPLYEMPQLLNVLRGEMSLVGPLPALPYEVSLYSPAQRLRLSTVPGMTGLWQVSGEKYLSFEKSIELDLDYVENRSISLYFRTLSMTVLAVLGVRLKDNYAFIRRSQEDASYKASPDDFIPISWRNLIFPERHFIS